MDIFVLARITWVNVARLKWVSSAQATYAALTDYNFHNKDEYYKIPLDIFKYIGFLKVGSPWAL